MSRSTGMRKGKGGNAWRLNKDFLKKTVIGRKKTNNPQGDKALREGFCLFVCFLIEKTRTHLCAVGREPVEREKSEEKEGNGSEAQVKLWALYSWYKLLFSVVRSGRTGRSS